MTKNDVFDFLQDQENQGIRRPSHVREQVIPQIYPPLAG